MKTPVLVAVLAIQAVLAACSQKTDEAATPAEAAAPVEAAAPTAAAAPDATAPAFDPSLVGTYDVKFPDGSMGRTVINADGSYVDTDPKGVEAKGRFTRTGTLDCFHPEGDQPAECWTASPEAADGTFTATSQDGKTTVMVKRVSP